MQLIIIPSYNFLQTLQEKDKLFLALNHVLGKSNLSLHLVLIMNLMPKMSVCYKQ